MYYNPAQHLGSCVIEHFADRFLTAADKKGAPVCVGLDPVVDRLPGEVVGGTPVARIESWCKGVLDAVAEHVPAVKPQLACFERYGSAGYTVYERVVAHARSLGLIVIADAKRGDIGLSSAHYAAGFFESQQPADALTVNAYLGADGLAPFAECAASAMLTRFIIIVPSSSSWIPAP